jgi:hypothetical protein
LTFEAGHQIHRRHGIAMVKQVFILLLSLTITFQGAAESLFDVSSLNFGRSIKHSVIPAFLSNSEQAHILVREFNSKGHRFISAFAMSGQKYFSTEAAGVIPVDPEVIFVDTGIVTNSEVESLILFTRNRAWRVDPLTGTRDHLIDFNSLYKRPVADELPSLDLVKDINGDDLDDIMVPDFDGYQVFLQREKGKFDDGKIIGVPVTMDLTWEDYPWYRHAKPYLADVNVDGLQDLLFWDGDHLQGYYQKRNRTFESHSVVYQPPVEFQNEGLAGLSMKLGGGDDQSNVTEKSLFRFADLNSDGLVDIITLNVHSKGVLNKTSTYEIYMGELDASDQLTFPEAPGSVIESDGVQFQMKELDFNEDGRTDFVVSSVEIALTKILAALITGSISQDLQFYQMGESGYSDEPNVVREITTTFSLRTGEVSYPTVLIIDVNGDDLVDLLVQDGHSRLKIYAGNASSRLFDRRPVSFDIPMPNDPDLVEVEDLNKDGREDIILRYDDGDDRRQKTVKVLISGMQPKPASVRR